MDANRKQNHESKHLTRKAVVYRLRTQLRTRPDSKIATSTRHAKIGSTFSAPATGRTASSGSWETLYGKGLGKKAPEVSSRLCVSPAVSTACPASRRLSRRVPGPGFVSATEPREWSNGFRFPETPPHTDASGVRTRLVFLAGRPDWVPPPLLQGGILPHVRSLSGRSTAQSRRLAEPRTTDAL